MDRSYKAKIIEDANQQSTRTVVDSARSEITIFRGNKKLKYFYFKPAIDSFGKPVFKDTVIVIFFSSDQNFELVRELCPASERSFEGLKYKGEHLGFVEFKYCDGKIKESGFRYNGDIGTWKEYDTTGKIISETEKETVTVRKTSKDLNTTADIGFAIVDFLLCRVSCILALEFEPINTGIIL